MNHRLAVVVVNYGSTDLLVHNLGPTAAQLPDPEIIVVDNFSTLDERTRAQSLAEKMGWRLLAMDTNAGFGGGANAGVNDALARGASDVLIVNPDARIDQASVMALLAAVAVNRLTVVSPVVREPSGRVWFAGLDLYLRDGTIRSPRRRSDHPDEAYVEWLSGACLLLTREVWTAVGGFDEDYFLYWEDVDWSRRVVDSGAELRVVHEATAVHEEGGTHRTAGQTVTEKSETYYYFNIRNRMLYAVRHLDPAGVRHWRRLAFKNAVQVLLRGGKRQFVRPLPPIRAAWRGLRDGRRIARVALSHPHAEPRHRLG